MRIGHPWVWLPVSWLCAVAVAVPAAAAGDGELARAVGRYGTVVVRPDPEGDYRFLVFADGVEVQHVENLVRAGPVVYADGAAVLPGRDREFVLIEAETGGLACPFRYVVVELGKQRPPVASAEFGTCAEMGRAEADGAVFRLHMDDYIPHPELLDARERRRRERTTVTYTWRDGVLRERRTLRR